MKLHPEQNQLTGKKNKKQKKQQLSWSCERMHTFVRTPTQARSTDNKLNIKRKEEIGFC